MDPSLDDFDIIIKRAITRAKLTRMRPLKFKETLQQKNKRLYQLLSSL
jgi:hypothetical protein